VLAVVIGVQGRMCSVKIANREDKTIPTGSLNELLVRTDLTHVCFSTMLDDKVSEVQVGDLVLYTTMPELAAAGKATVAGTVVARVNPHYTSKGGWQVKSAEQKQQSAEPQDASAAQDKSPEQPSSAPTA
jgi:hypothetical protein